MHKIVKNRGGVLSFDSAQDKLAQQNCFPSTQLSRTALNTKNIVIGIGCDRGTPLKTLEHVLIQALAEINASFEDITCFATIDKKADEEAINTLVKHLDKPIIHYPASKLAEVEVPNPSEVVMKYVGTPAVSEAAAILAANTTMKNLLVEKLKYRGEDGKNATISIVKT